MPPVTHAPSREIRYRKRRLLAGGRATSSPFPPSSNRPLDKAADTYDGEDQHDHDQEHANEVAGREKLDRLAERDHRAHIIPLLRQCSPLCFSTHARFPGQAVGARA